MSEDVVCSRVYLTKDGSIVEVRFRKPVERKDAWPECSCEIERGGKIISFTVSGSDTLDAFFGAVKMVKFNLERLEIDDHEQLSWLYDAGILGLPVSYDCPD